MRESLLQRIVFQDQIGGPVGVVFFDRKFDETLGSVGVDHFLGEETELIRLASEAGEVGVWVPSAEVKHLFARERLSLLRLWKVSVANATYFYSH